MENGYKEDERRGSPLPVAPPLLPAVVNPSVGGRGRGRGFRQPVLDDFQLLINSIVHNAQSRTDVCSEEEKPLLNIGRGRGRLRNRGNTMENFGQATNIGGQCRNVLSNIHHNVLFTPLNPDASKEWFSDCNSVYSNTKTRSISNGRTSRSDAEVYYSKYNDSDSVDDTPSSTVTSLSSGRNVPEQLQIADVELVEEPNVKVNSPLRVNNNENDIRVEKCRDMFEKSVEDDVVIEQIEGTVEKAVENAVIVDNTNIKPETNNNISITSMKDEEVVLGDVVKDYDLIDLSEPIIVETGVGINEESDENVQKTVKSDVEIGCAEVKAEINNNGGVRSKNNDVVITKTVKTYVRNDRNETRRIKADASFVKDVDPLEKRCKSDVKVGKNEDTVQMNTKANCKNDDKVKKNGGAFKKSNKTDIRIVDKNVRTEKSDPRSDKMASCGTDHVVTKDFDHRKGYASKLDESCGHLNKRDSVVDNWWEIDTASGKSSPYDKSNEIPEKDVETSKQSSFVPLSTFSLPKNSNQSVYGNWETAYLSDVRAFDAFGKQKRNTFPRFSIERDFPVLGANRATNSSIRPPSPVVRNVEQQREPKKKPKQVSKPVTNIFEKPVGDSGSRPGTIRIRNLPKDATIGSIRDMMETFGAVDELVMVPSDSYQIARVTFSDHETCNWVKDCLDDSIVPLSGCTNRLSIKIL